MAVVAETPRFIFRLPPELRTELQLAADEEHRNLSNLIIHIIREWLADRRRAKGLAS